MTIAVLDKDGNPVTINTIDDLITVIGTGASPAANTVQARLESLKGFVDGLEGLATTLNTQTDTLETLIASTNTLLTTQNGYLDTVETLLGAATPAGTNNIGDVDVLTLSGQTLAFGTGASSTNVPRVVIASDSQTAQVGNSTSGVASSASALNIPVVSYLYGYNGTTYDQLLVDVTTKGLKSAGDVAHDAADAGAPQKVGGKATAALSGETVVAAGDRTQFYGELDGAQITRNGCSLGDLIDGTASNTDGTSTAVIAAAGAGIKQYLTRVSLSNTHASTSVMVALKSGTTTKWRVNVPPGGRELAFDPPLKPNAANEAWNFDPDAAVTTIECSMNGFKSKV